MITVAVCLVFAAGRPWVPWKLPPVASLAPKGRRLRGGRLGSRPNSNWARWRRAETDGPQHGARRQTTKGCCIPNSRLMFARAAKEPEGPKASTPSQPSEY